MSLNHHGLPTRVPVIAEIGRLLGDPQVPDADKRTALDVLLHDHADLDEVETQSALWAIGQLGPQPIAVEALLHCAPQWLHSSETALCLLDCYQSTVGQQVIPQAVAVFAQLALLGAQDRELAQRLAQFAPAPAAPT